MVIEIAPLTEHKYLQQVYSLLSESVNENHREDAEYPGDASIYNFRMGS
jgi:hypothetical protein